MKEHDDRLDRLEAFLCGDDDAAKAEVFAELRDQGVNSHAFLERVRRTVQEGYSRQLRRLAESQQADRSCDQRFLSRLAEMPRDALLRLFEKIRSGEFGTEYREAALARCRNRSAAELTDEELRAWLEDVGDIFGEIKE